MVRTDDGCSLTLLNAHRDLPKSRLDTYIGKTIDQICDCGFGTPGDAHNHCAHFVSHVMDYTYGTVCTAMLAANPATAGLGRTIRVNDIFNNCPTRGNWDDKPDSLYYCLIFAVHSSGINATTPITITDQRRKHVGIYVNGDCYNYHNTTNEAVRSDGVSRFRNLYGAGTRVLYASFP